MLIALLAFLALFAVSVISDRVLKWEGVTFWTFLSAGLFMFALFSQITFYVVVGKSPEELDAFLLNTIMQMGPEDGITFYETWLISKFGGWSGIFTAVFFSVAGASIVMTLLALALDEMAEEMNELMGVICIVALFTGIVFALGFIKFFEGVALILGIVATIVGILVGIKRLSARDRNK